MDAKKLAMIIGIGILLPLFLGLFVDAVYPQPVYGSYCNTQTSPMYKSPASGVNCSDSYGADYSACLNDSGNPVFDYDNSNCQVYKSCDYCSKNFNNDQQVYNRNIFFILAPLGLIIVVLGIYLSVDYLGAGLMFGGLITMFYATVRYFSDMSKVIRALVILVELLIIMWIGYKKIDDNKKGNGKSSGKKKRG